jgi:hypothetical protein
MTKKGSFKNILKKSEDLLKNKRQKMEKWNYNY